MSALNSLAGTSSDVFDEEQKVQLNLAREHVGTNSDIFKHTEWSPAFMNYVWNREKKGKEDVWNTIADWIKDNWPYSESKYLVDMRSDILSSLFSIAESDIGMLRFLELPMGSKKVIPEGGAFSIFRMERIIKDSFEVQESGRCKIGETGFFTQDTIMAEGLQTVKDFLPSLKECYALLMCNATGDNSREQKQWGKTSCIFTLDDMNIRGQQLLDAYQYASNSTHKLAEILYKSRSEELVSYINCKAAQRFKDTGITQQLAVTDGASYDKKQWSLECLTEFGKYSINILNYEQYMCDIYTVKVDWATLNISRNCTMADAENIMKARGFKLVHKYKHQMPFRDSGYSILWYHPEFGVQGKADSAQEGNICYGGFSLTCFVSDRNGVFHTSGPITEYNDATGNFLMYIELNHHDGLFTDWDKLQGSMVRINDEDWTYISLTSHGINVPTYVNANMLGYDTDVNIYLNYDRDFVGYNCDELINCIVAHFDNSFDECVSPLYNELKSSDWIKYIVSHQYPMYYTENRYIMCLSLALRVLNAPSNILEEFYSQLLEHAIAYDDKCKANQYWDEDSSAEANMRDIHDDFINGYATDKKLMHALYDGMSIPYIYWDEGTVSLPGLEGGGTTSLQY